MPIYSVHGPDHEDLGEVYIKPPPQLQNALEEAHELGRYEAKVAEALAGEGFIRHSQNAGYHFFIEYYAAARYGAPHDRVVQLPSPAAAMGLWSEGRVPFLWLQPQELSPSPLPDPFWTFDLTPQGSYTLIGALRYIAESQRLHISVVSLRRDKGIDSFEWPLVEWLNNPTYGFDPVNGEPLAVPRRIDEILVSLDAEMEKH